MNASDLMISDHVSSTERTRNDMSQSSCARASFTVVEHALKPDIDGVDFAWMCAHFGRRDSPETAPSVSPDKIIPRADTVPSMEPSHTLLRRLYQIEISV